MKIGGRCFSPQQIPLLEIEVDPAFRFLGGFDFDLKGIARAERHLFVEPAGKLARRMVIVQYEGFLEGNSMSYSYQPERPVRLGGQVYGRDNYFFSIAADIAAAPGTEIDYTLRFLGQAGYEVEDEQMTTRFARILGPGRRHEVLIFYHENISSTGRRLAEIARDDLVRPEYQEIAEALTRRALNSFSITE